MTLLFELRGVKYGRQIEFVCNIHMLIWILNTVAADRISDDVVQPRPKTIWCLYLAISMTESLDNKILSSYNTQFCTIKLQIVNLNICDFEKSPVVTKLNEGKNSYHHLGHCY